jgi:hypothetical protein
MGSQQLLFVVLSVILVGIAVALAITLFQANMVESSRDSITNDLLYFATRARDYYWRPATLGGGNRTFIGVTFSKLSNMTSNDNGRYFIASTSQHELVIVGIGRVAVGTDTTQVQVIVNEQNNTFQIIH